MVFERKHRERSFKSLNDESQLIPSRELHITQKWHFEDDFPFPKVGYVNSLEGIYLQLSTCWSHVTPAGGKHTSSLFGSDLGEFAIGPITRVFCFGFGGGDLV